MLDLKHYVQMLCFLGMWSPCASLESVIIPPTVTGHHSLFAYVFSQQTDKVLHAAPDLSTAVLVEVMTMLSTVPKADLKELTF